ncbi:type VI secretion system-associated protein TagF [Viridibacterium curvum]|uniref:Type VI secretion system-associated protein TagF n=1 Tax=Viridibacterium curvum TaxID=1101404 RepID=A0ABP9QJ58_9RHOO
MNSPHHPTTVQEALIYFGKLPSRGDFVRSTSGAAIIQPLDRWMTVSLEQLATAPDWKQQFDAMVPVEFAFVGSRSASVLAGRMVGSRDSVGRRFPFLIAGNLGTSAPLDLLRVLPMALLPAWTDFSELANNALAATEIETALERIDLAHLQADTDLDGLRVRLANYLETATLSNLQRMLVGSGNPVDVRQTIIALGLLLTPLLSQNTGGATKGLALPLPGSNSAAVHVASFWLCLLAPFLTRDNFDLNLMRTQLAGRPQLVISFNGASPRALEAILNPQLAFDINIDMCQAEWVEDYVASEYPLTKLSSYLEHPELSLGQALNTFNEVFLGA